jgi:hypothetical protein
LVLVYHQALAATLDWRKPVTLLNIGGRQPPKSLDRNAFTGLALLAVAVYDGAALTMPTAEGTAASRDHLPRISQLNRCRPNETLMAMLAA